MYRTAFPYVKQPWGQKINENVSVSYREILELIRKKLEGVQRNLVTTDNFANMDFYTLRDISNQLHTARTYAEMYHGTGTLEDLLLAVMKASHNADVLLTTMSVRDYEAYEIKDAKEFFFDGLNEALEIVNRPLDAYEREVYVDDEGNEAEDPLLKEEKASLRRKMIRVANGLDDMGLHWEADFVTHLMKK